MSRIVDLISQHVEQKDENGASSPFYSFEYFPPKTADGEKNLLERLKIMQKMGPKFIDFTWGAGGATSDTTLRLCKAAKDLGFEVNMHLTCTNMDIEKAFAALKECKDAGIRNICALRGDPPHGQSVWKAAGFECGRDLVSYIVKQYGDWFGIQVAGYPEGHPDVIKPVGERELSPSEEARSCIIEVDGVKQKHVCSDEDYKKEIAYLKSKIDAGGHVIISQLFYDVKVFLQFVKDCRAAGITVPILPGIMPILKHGGFKRMTTLCKTRVPTDIENKVDGLKDDVAGLKQYGTDLCATMCQELLNNGIGGLHFYCLNLRKATEETLKGLKLLPAEYLAAGAA